MPFLLNHRRWLAAGVVGLLAALTRSTGVVLAVPLVLFYLQAVDWQWRRIRAGEVDEIRIAYTKFQTAITQIPTIIKLLPVEPPDAASGGTGEDYLFEPAPAQLLGELLPRYVVTQVYRALVE